MKSPNETNRFPMRQVENLCLQHIPRLRPNSKICSRGKK